MLLSYNRSRSPTTENLMINLIFETIFFHPSSFQTFMRRNFSLTGFCNLEEGITFRPREFTLWTVQFSPLAGQRNVCCPISNDRLAFARLFARTWSRDCDFDQRFPDSVPQFRYALLRAFCTPRGDQQRFVRAPNAEPGEHQLTGRDDSRFGSRHTTNAGKTIDIPARNTRRGGGTVRGSSYCVSQLTANARGFVEGK